MMIGGGLMAAASATATAEVEYELHAGYHSIYEFRGVNFGDNMAEAGFDFSTELGSGITLSGGAWYQDSDGNNAIAAFDELDIYFGLSKTFGKVDVSIGYTSYQFPGPSVANANTDEWYFGLATELENGIGLSLTYTHDTNVIDAGYLEFEASYEQEINSSLSINYSLGAAYSFGYNPDVDGTTLEGFNHYFASVSLSWEYTEGMTLSPYIKFVGASSSLNNGDSVLPSSDDLFIGGVVLSYSF